MGNYATWLIGNETEWNIDPQPTISNIMTYITPL